MNIYKIIDLLWENVQISNSNHHLLYVFFSFQLSSQEILLKLMHALTIVDVISNRKVPAYTVVLQAHPRKSAHPLLSGQFPV